MIINNIIIKSLIIAVLHNKPHFFLYHLKKNQVETTFPNKWNFYKFFSFMLKCAYETSKGKMYLKIENPKYEDEGFKHYNFYDNYHKYCRLTVKIKETNNILTFDMPPF